MAGEAEAGWFPDPTGRWEYRYWDGSSWTEHVSRNGEQAADAVLAPPQSDAVVPVTPPAAAAAADVESAAAPKGFFARRKAEREQVAADRASFEALTTAAVHGDTEALAALPAAVARARTLWKANEFDQKMVDALVAAIRHVMADDCLTPEEEEHIQATAEALGTSVQALQTLAPDAFEEIAIRVINAGRWQPIEIPGLILGAGEVAYASFAVDLMKEVAVREWRGGTSGVSIPIVKGVRYHVGGVRGRSVVVGTQLTVQDSGALAVTSKRLLFTGSSKTLEFRRDKLVGVQQYTDGVRLSVSNRQTASLFRLRTGQSTAILAALIAQVAA